MKFLTLAVLTGACIMASAAQAQMRPQSDHVVELTDPSAVAQAEDHARAAAASAQRAEDQQMHEPAHPHRKHHPMMKHPMKPMDKPAS